VHLGLGAAGLENDLGAGFAADLVKAREALTA
jgi:hypothetical protein